MQRRQTPLFARLRSVAAGAAACLWFGFLLLLPLPAGADEPTQLANASSAVADPEPSQKVEIVDEPIAVQAIDLTVQPDDLWQRVRNGFSMPNLDSPLVAERQAWYLNRPQMLRDMLNRSHRYLYYIVQELEKRGMPTELALLPIVESAFNPLAYSRAKALGIWQFVPSTGKTYRLEQNWWLDQRRDVVASTGAALDYLQYIYEMQGDWHLALASYNWGENAVARAVAKNQALGLPADYQHIRMPGETRYYVPKLQALKNIIANPEAYGIHLDAIPNQPYFDSVNKPATMDMLTAAKLAEIPIDEFIALNPAYSRPVIPDTASAPLLLPADKVAVFRANLERQENEEKPLCVWHTHTLKKGERLDRIAAQNGLTLAHLKQINGIGPRTRLRPGMNLLVPDKDAAGAPALLFAKLPVIPEAGTGGRSRKVHGKVRHAGRKRVAAATARKVRHKGA